MSREKNKYTQALSVFFAGTKMYFRHVDKFLSYMAFPVLGQLFGFVAILAITSLYAVNIENLAKDNPFFDNMTLTLTVFLLVLIPVLIIVCKAVYDYLIAMASLNSIANNLTSRSKNRILDTKIHDELIKRRSFNYLMLIFILGIIYTIGMLPFFWVILAPFLVYSSLTLQVFTLEENAGPVFAIKRSFMLIKNNFWATTILLVLISLLTFLLLPNVIVWACDEVDIISFFASPVEKFIDMLPIQLINQIIYQNHLGPMLVPFELARGCISSIISTVVMAFTLPLRSCCCTLWYKYLDDDKIEANRKATKLDGREELKKIISPRRVRKKESN